MKNNILKLTATAFLALALIGCGGENGSPTTSKKNIPSTNKEKNVDSRSFKINFEDRNDIKLTWDKIENSDYYKVKIDKDFDKLVMLPQYTLKPQLNWVDVSQLSNGTWWISVKAENGVMKPITTFTITDNNAFIGSQKDSDKSTADSFTESMLSSSTWEVNGTVNSSFNKDFTVTFNPDHTITNSSGSTGINSSDKWSSKGGKLYSTYSLYGTTISYQTFTITGDVDGCLKVTGRQSNSSWSADYIMCRK
jgi:hypothetical protein